MIQGLLQIHFHSSLIKSLKNINKIRYFPVRKLSWYMRAWYGPEHQFSFEVIYNFSQVYVSLEDLVVSRMHVDLDRLMTEVPAFRPFFQCYGWTL